MTELHLQADNVYVQSGEREIENTGELHITCEPEGANLDLLPTGYFNDSATVRLSPSAAISLAHKLLSHYA